MHGQAQAGRSHELNTAHNTPGTREMADTRFHSHSPKMIASTAEAGIRILGTRSGRMLAASLATSIFEAE